MACSDAVSYTHLDVYKRQARRIQASGFLGFCSVNWVYKRMTRSPSPVLPVSYTHLLQGVRLRQRQDFVKSLNGLGHLFLINIQHGQMRQNGCVFLSGLLRQRA